MGESKAARALNIAELRGLARRRLPRGIYDYLDRGVEDEVCFADNRAAFQRTKLLPRALRDVSAVDTATSLLGRSMPLPFAIGPTGGAALFWHDGDVALARAAAARRIPFTISSASTMDVEQIATAGGTLWFQLYLWEDRALSHAAMARARAVGCDLLFVTADMPVTPNREYNTRNGFGFPFRLGPRNVADVVTHPRWAAGVLGRYALSGGMPRQGNLPPGMQRTITRSAPVGAAFDHERLHWDDLARLRDRWRGPCIVKGLVHPADAERAVALGMDGVVVSNHGGRALDGCVAALDALAGVVDAIGGRIAVMADGGVMRGGDVVKAMALGADAVLVGRAAVYGLAAGGEAGVGRALDLLTQEVRRTMAQTGSRCVAEITRDLIAR